MLMLAEWLKSMRKEYAAKESALERHVYEIRDGSFQCMPWFMVRTSWSRLMM
jgi:hypothetical protein